MAPTKKTSSTRGKEARREKRAAISELLGCIRQAALDGDRYTLCLWCQHGPLDPDCHRVTARINKGFNEWSQEGTILVCCKVNQVLRNGVFTREEARNRLRDAGVALAADPGEE